MKLLLSIINFYHVVLVRIQTPLKPFILNQILKKLIQNYILKMEKSKNRNGRIFSIFDPTFSDQNLLKSVQILQM